MSEMPILFIVKSTASGNHKLVKGDWLEITRQFCLKCQLIKLDVQYIYIKKKKNKKIWIRNQIIKKRYNKFDIYNILFSEYTT